MEPEVLVQEGDHCANLGVHWEDNIKTDVPGVVWEGRASDGLL
jgi:hypothetical protein